ncbi:MAG: hypothetical protein JNM43_21275 [Planctomycetaceae bacterium]|nr:hypothetical protein [Planctomycetaceae bacterium]
MQAGSLEIGERLQTLSGDVKVVQQKLPRPGPEPVFNLEVHAEHVYFVGEDGVLVHNSYQTTNATGNVALGQRLQAYKAWKASKGITGRPTSQQFKNFVTGNTGKNGGGFYVASGFGRLANDRNRRLGVSLAWKAESLLLQQGTPSRPWTATEQLELLSTGKVSGYHGHHINSVSRFPHLAADPRNIKFLSPTDHLAAHFGSWRNPTSGPLRTDF